MWMPYDALVFPMPKFSILRWRLPRAAASTLDALNAQPDTKFMNLDAALRNALVVGRPFGDA
jgi:hypothetical protein